LRDAPSPAMPVHSPHQRLTGESLDSRPDAGHVETEMHPITFTRSSPRPRRRPSTAVRYTLLTPPARLTVEEAAALLRLPRRAVESELEWLVPATGDVSDGVCVRDRPDLYA
jgi:hypothetical protein